MTSKHVDIIIVGSGMAGLYSAYNIKKISPNIISHINYQL
jgi:monoamine oxidase